jgi:hypothetical protein
MMLDFNCQVEFWLSTLFAQENYSHLHLMQSYAVPNSIWYFNLSTLWILVFRNYCLSEGNELSCSYLRSGTQEC